MLTCTKSCNELASEPRADHSAPLSLLTASAAVFSPPSEAPGAPLLVHTHTHALKARSAENSPLPGVATTKAAGWWNSTAQLLWLLLKQLWRVFFSGSQQDWAKMTFYTMFALLFLFLSSGPTPPPHAPKASLAHKGWLLGDADTQLGMG